MRGLEHLHPAVRQKAACLMAQCMVADLPLLITETWRTQAEQDALYAKGRTAAGSVVTNAQYPNSMHCWGLAFDFCKNIKGKEYDDGDNFFRRVGEIGRGLGLTWGGDWAAIKDKPHFEDRSVIGQVADAVKAYGTPEKFKAEWRV